jgi:hypothetical protein
MSPVPMTEFDRELREMKNLVESLSHNQRMFHNTFQTLKPKERINLMKKIEADQKKVESFIQAAKTKEIVNAGSKFSLENLKQSLMSFKVQWKKTCLLLESASSAPGRKTEPLTESPAESQTECPAEPLTEPVSVTEKAIEHYRIALEKLGHPVHSDHLKEFENNLNSAYKKAKDMSGGKDLGIEIVEVEGKIKVRMVPKI